MTKEEKIEEARARLKKALEALRQSVKVLRLKLLMRNSTGGIAVPLIVLLV